MQARPSPALRTLARRSSFSDSPTGRAMPNLRPEPVGILGGDHDPVGQHRRPGWEVRVDDAAAERLDLLAILAGRGEEASVLRERERYFAALAPGRGEDRGEQVRQVHLGVRLAHDLAVPLDHDVEAAAGEGGAAPGRTRGGARVAGGGRGGSLGRGARRRRGRRDGPAVHGRGLFGRRCAGLLVGDLLGLGDLLLQLRGAHLDTLDDPEHPLIYFADHLLPVFRREFLPLFARADQLLNHLAADRHHVELDAILLRVGVGPGGGRRGCPGRHAVIGGVAARRPRSPGGPLRNRDPAGCLRARSRGRGHARDRDRSVRRRTRQRQTRSPSRPGAAGAAAPSGGRASRLARSPARVRVPAPPRGGRPMALAAAFRARFSERRPPPRNPRPWPPRPSPGPCGAPGGGPPCRRPRTSMLLRSIATSPSAAATESSRVESADDRDT